MLDYVGDMPIGLEDVVSDEARKEQWPERRIGLNKERKAARAKVWYEDNKVRILANQKSNASANRNKQLIRKYGITLEDYEVLLKNQGGVCGICGKPPKPDRALDVDHDHKTGKVRGLLCHNCNYRVLGRTTLEKFRLVVNYLERHEARVQAENENNGRSGSGKTPSRRKAPHPGNATVK